MNTVKKLVSRAGLVGLGLAASAHSYAAIDVSGAVSELQDAGAAAGTLIAAAIVFAGICMAGFALYRRIK